MSELCERPVAMRTNGLQQLAAAERAVLSDDGVTIRLALYSEADQVAAIALGNQLITAGLLRRLNDE